MKTFYISHVGCSKRLLDCERIKNYLHANSMREVETPEKADYIIVSTCGLSEFHEKESIYLITEANKKQATTIVYGCMPAMNQERIEKVFDGPIIVTKDLEKFDQLWDDAEVKFSDLPDANFFFQVPNLSFKEKLKKKLQRIDLLYPLKLYNLLLSQAERMRRGIKTIFPKLLSSPLITRVPLYVVESNEKYFTVRVSDGCLGKCSYCSIREAIGRLKSKPIPEILAELEKAVNTGHHKVSLLSSDTGSYGQDINSTLPELLQSILEYDRRITIDYIEDIHPVWIVRYQHELTALIKTKRIKSFTTAIQSGSKRILKLMNRDPHIERYFEALKMMKHAYPRLRLRTFVIIGFPTETEQDFEATLDFLNKCRFDEVDIFQYYETKNMDSASILPKVPLDVIMDRIRRVQENLANLTITHTLYEGLQKK
ncbi:radical SAM protein [candidate division CSSED10-310 bacterium]|uniref:Radical SAM protein n=1 Tax=candidate division CSSED10-310 bacterium TaxID=2855610 RepID=A0ABV6Z5G8_UNCC1